MRFWIIYLTLIVLVGSAHGVRAEEAEALPTGDAEQSVDSEKTPARDPASAPDPASEPDLASAPPKVLPDSLAPLRTRLVGKWRSEILLSERPRMRHLGGGRYGVRTDKVFPFYNTIELGAYEIGHKGLSLHFRGWAGLDLADIYFDLRFVADLTTLYLQFRDFGVDAKVGRQMVFDGAARGLHIDGVNISYESPVHLGVQIFGGLAVSPKQGPDWYRGEQANGSRDFGSGYSNWEREGEFGDWAVGGRVFYRVTEVVSAGVSFLHTRRDTEIDEQVVGADLNLSPVSWMALAGNALLVLPGSLLKEANVALDFFPWDRVTLGVDYRHADPTLYISRMSIFSVFSNEKYDAFGGNLRVRLWKWLAFSGGYHHHIYRFIENPAPEAASGAGYVGDNDMGYEIEAGLRLGRMDLLGVVRMDFRRLKQDLNGMNQIYLGAAIPIPSTSLVASANAHLDVYDTSINGETVALLGDLGLNWKNDEWEVGGAFAAGITPHARNELRGLLKATYYLDLNFMERRQP